MSHMIGVQPEVVESLWPTVEPLIQRCFDKVKEYRWAPSDVLELLQQAKLQLWLCVGEAEDDTKFYNVVITSIEIYPRAKECVVWLLCGKLPKDWRECLEELHIWAKFMGCTHMSAYTRPGLIKITGMSKGLTRCYRGLK